MKQGIVYFLAFLLVLTSIVSGNPKQERLVVMTFNLRYGTANDGENSWMNRKSILIDCLKKYQPDILGTQEALGFQIDEIKDHFIHYQSVGVGRYHNVLLPDRPHENMSGEACKILFDVRKFELLDQGTFWHSKTPDVPGSISWGNSLPRIVTWAKLKSKSTGKIFVVMNTHFHWDEPYVSNTTKLIMQKWSEITNGLPTILMGDFNLPPTSDTHEIFCGRKGDEKIRGSFIDCWQALGKGENGSGSSHGFTGRMDRNRIDWILVTPQFDVKEAEIIHYNENGKYPSDHFPVQVIIELK